MAAITKADVAYVTPPGMEVGDRGYALTDMEPGDPVVIASSAAPSRQYDCSISKATGTEVHGFAIKSKKAGGLCEFVTQGEFDGYTGLTPGAALTVVDGAIDDTAPAAGVTPSIRVVNASRIRVLLV